MLSCFLRPLSLQLILCSQNYVSSSIFAGNQITTKQLLHNKCNTLGPQVWGISAVACFARLVIKHWPFQIPGVVQVFRLLNLNHHSKHKVWVFQLFHRFLVGLNVNQWPFFEFHNSSYKDCFPYFYFLSTEVMATVQTDSVGTEKK